MKWLEPYHNSFRELSRIKKNNTYNKCHSHRPVHIDFIYLLRFFPRDKAGLTDSVGDLFAFFRNEDIFR